MFLNRYYFMRRRNLYKLIILGLFTYVMYISLSDGTQTSPKHKKIVIRELGNDYHVENNDNNINNVHIDDKHVENNEKQIDNPGEADNHINQDKTNELRKLIDKYDNYKNYNSIRNNGADAKGMTIDDKKLSPEEKEKYDEGWNKYAFNNYVSNLMPFNRSIPDIRLPGCKNDPLLPNLPQASVIMCFHNEAWGVLIRGINSIIDRSPPNLLKEILLVDDFSDFDYLGEAFDLYLKENYGNKVRVLRNTKREGLIRSRLHGARVASGEVLIFLDSHIEATIGWLEPLLNEIKKDETNVVTPMIDVIDKQTFEYKYSTSSRVSVGGFDWNLQFTWHGLPERLYKDRKSDHDPVPSPTMAGGLFAMSKSYFERLGTYDAQMDIWGGENLEISFRIWMCGGKLLTAPCSHVGHIFRERSPYKWLPGVDVVRKNSIRVAEVWMDDYKNIYYERLNFKLGNYGDVTERKQLRDKLQCKSFKWYIETIYPELWIPSNSLYSGAISSNAYCFDALASRRNVEKPVKANQCHNQGGNQIYLKSNSDTTKKTEHCLQSENVRRKAKMLKKIPLKPGNCIVYEPYKLDYNKQMWYFSKESEIRRDDICLDYPGGLRDVNQPDKIITFPCHGEKGNQEWIYTKEKQITHKLSNLCIELTTAKQLIMAHCDQSKSGQIWNWKKNDKQI